MIKQKTAYWFVAGLVIIFLIIVCISQSGCQMVAGAGRDITWLAESTETALQTP